MLVKDGFGGRHPGSMLEQWRFAAMTCKLCHMIFHMIARPVFDKHLADAARFALRRTTA